MSPSLRRLDYFGLTMSLSPWLDLLTKLLQFLPEPPDPKLAIEIAQPPEPPDPPNLQPSLVTGDVILVCSGFLPSVSDCGGSGFV